MTTAFDRLEKLFFSRRKTSTASTDPEPEATTPSQDAVPGLDHTFPAPSFMRPTASRMTAREDAGANKQIIRSSSLSVALMLQRSASVASYCSNNTCTSPKQVAKTRLPSLIPYENDSLMTSLRQYSFMQEASPDDDSTLRPGQSSPSPPQTPVSQRPASPSAVSPLSGGPPPMDISPARLATPPSSDVEDEDTLLPEQCTFMSSANAPPTPESSARSSLNLRSSSVPNLSHLRSSQSLELLPRPWTGARAASESSASATRDSFYWTDGPASSWHSANTSICSTSSILREPDFSDFLSLSDDDIAEEAALPPMALSISPPNPNAATLMTLSPPRTSRPATAAAFEAARIANRYDFDLVYVVNLWPDNTSLQPDADVSPMSLEKPMVGRLLAAHGLHHVPSPLQISSNVHAIILRTEGWIEYSNPAAQKHDLARGYACAFYTGQYAGRGGSVDSNASHASSRSASGRRLSGVPDRGIVFAAYRLPRPSPHLLGVDLGKQDLGNLHRDAEALVEMLIDIHVANRLRQPPSFSHTQTEGPISSA
ncbi:hypothetical protein B0I35DRAFT_224236 [Stachybotrys elegans]|uniref:Uncharacterized protein n=1 Tax=Stachybotrys elegans TaxID=80388 RepID=A0A8K0ST42_9HYPO|nr:hypothetical protein B0I35DRAFT_224236 [Stachybotrys elegans]